MTNGMVRCRECGKWYFNWKKLANHLIGKHGYIYEITKKEENND